MSAKCLKAILLKMTDEKMKGILEDLGKSLTDMIKKIHGEIEVVEGAE